MRRALRSYALLLWWQFLRERRGLIMIVVIQAILAVGIVYGLAFLIPNIDARSAMYLATGAPTLTLLILGLTVVPQDVSRARLTGQSDYLATLPIPRLAQPAAQLSFWLLVQLPGSFLALILASLRFNFALDVKAALLPVMLLVALSGASVGYALAMLLQPRVAFQLSSLILFGNLLFSPINFPAERMPNMMQVIHRILPIQHMADLVRWGLTGQEGGQVGIGLAIVSAWCLAAIALSWRVAVRRI